MIQYTSWFKNSDRGKSGASLYIWNLNHFDIDFYHMLIFHLSPPPLLSAKPRQRTLRGLLGSSDSLWISVRGFHAAEKLNNNCKKTDRLFPKCHVSLNESQRWLFLPVMATDNGVQNLSPGAHLHSNKPPTSCSPFCCFFYSFLFFFFFSDLRDRKQIAFQQRQRCDNLSIQYKSFARRSWRFISYLTGGSQLYRNCTVLYSMWTVMKCLVMLNGNPRDTWPEKKKEKKNRSD